MIELEKLEEINEYILEYLSYFNMSETIEIYKKETKSKMMAKRLRKKDLVDKVPPRISLLFDDSASKTKNELNLNKNFKDLNKKHKLVMQGARQIFSVSINFIQNLMGVKEVMTQESVIDLLESYKI